MGKRFPLRRTSVSSGVARTWDLLAEREAEPDLAPVDGEQAARARQ